MHSCNEVVAQAIIFALRDRNASEMREALIHLLPLHLRLLYTHKIYIYIYAPKRKPNENSTVKHSLQDLRFIKNGIWKASIQKKKKKDQKKKLTIIANKFNNYSSIQQSKHYKLQHKTTRKYTPKIA